FSPKGPAPGSWSIRVFPLLSVLLLSAYRYLGGYVRVRRGNAGFIYRQSGGFLINNIEWFARASLQTRAAHAGPAGGALDFALADGRRWRLVLKHTRPA